MTHPPRGRTDIHAHVLPGVDDGPASMEESLELLRLAAEDGTARMVATPHVDRLDVLEVRDRVAELQQAVDAAGLRLEVLPGGELQAADLWSLDARRLEAIACGPPARRWILLEPPWRDGAGTVLAAADELRDRGYGVVLAHPERADGLWQDAAGGIPVVPEAAWVQVTAASLAGRGGAVVRARAERLARSSSRLVVASDAHHPTQRPPGLSGARDALLALGLPRRRVIGAVDVAGKQLVDDGAQERGTRGAPVTGAFGGSP